MEGRNSLTLCGSWFQTVGPWCVKVCWPVHFVSTEGVETDECQRRNVAIETENKSWECRQGIEDRCQWQKKDRWKSVCILFVDGLETSEVHAEVGKCGQVWWPEDYPSRVVLDFSYVSWGDTLGIQLEEGCSDQALTEQRNTRGVFLWHQQRDSDGLNGFFCVRNRLFCRCLKCAVWRWVLDQEWLLGCGPEIIKEYWNQWCRWNLAARFLNLDGMARGTCFTFI